MKVMAAAVKGEAITVACKGHSFLPMWKTDNIIIMFVLFCIVFVLCHPL